MLLPWKLYIKILLTFKFNSSILDSEGKTQLCFIPPWSDTRKRLWHCDIVCSELIYLCIACQEANVPSIVHIFHVFPKHNTVLQVHLKKPHENHHLKSIHRFNNGYWLDDKLKWICYVKVMTHWKLCIDNRQNSKSLNAKTLIKLVVLACTFSILGVLFFFLFLKKDHITN